jgi:3-dehydroquinate dehydratase
MTIFVVTGPRSLDSGAHGIPREVVSQLAEHAAMAGKTIAVHGCASTRDVLRCLHSAGDNGAEFILLDPGPHAHCDGRFGHALESLAMPYIEVHDDSFDALEASLAPGVGNPLNVIHGYNAQSYVLALSIALEHLGCAECENDLHVGI